ncbi:hypothetical protein AAEX37_01937 [Oligella sp. MSHR50489EDL]
MLTLTACSTSTSYTHPPLPGNLTQCTDPQPPAGNHFDDVAIALADAVTRYYECKIKLDAVVGLWGKGV